MVTTVRNTIFAFAGRIAALIAAGLCALAGAHTSAAATLNGRVLGAGEPVAGSTVTLYVASADAPKRLAQARTGSDGRFTLDFSGASTMGTSHYLVAKSGKSAADKSSGDNPALAAAAKAL